MERILHICKKTHTNEREQKKRKPHQLRQRQTQFKRRGDKLHAHVMENLILSRQPENNHSTFVAFNGNVFIFAHHRMKHAKCLRNAKKKFIN